MAGEVVQEDPKKAELLRLVTKAKTSNVAGVEFPADKWGFVSALKKELLKAASNVRGQEDKQETLINTLTVAITHIKHRLEEDKANRKVEYDRVMKLEADRQHLERVTGRVPGTSSIVGN